MKKTVFSIVSLAFVLLHSTLFAQAPDTLWTRRYNGPANSNDEASACAVDASGNLYVTGYSINGANWDYLTIKYNPLGDTLWTRKYNSPADNQDKAYDCVVDSLDNLFIIGWSITSNNWDYLTIKYNLSGDTLWTRRFNSPYSDSSWDCANACAVDGLGNVYVTGECSYYSRFGITIKYNESGDTIWTRNHNTFSTGSINTCAIDDSNNLYLAGYCFNGLNYDYYIIKYNAFGDTLWTRRYHNPTNPADGWDRANACAVDTSGNLYVVCGGTIIKYNTFGDTIWIRNAGGSDCAVDGSNSLYVTGTASNGDNNDYLTVKYNTAGDVLWTHRYNGPANEDDYASGCVVDSLGNLYITGLSNNGTNYDYLTIKYNSTMGVEGKPELPIIGDKLRLEQNRPNPFSQHTTISYQLPNSGPASLKIYNSAGQLVKTFDMGQQQAGHHQVEWRDSKITAGVYFYRLTVGNHQATKKLVVLK